MLWILEKMERKRIVCVGPLEWIFGWVKEGERESGVVLDCVLY